MFNLFFYNWKFKLQNYFSANQINGLEAKNYILKALEEFPQMRILIKLIKYILRMNHLNETCSGGVGSFLIFNLVYAYFLYLKRNEKGNLIVLFMPFFFLYAI